MRDYGTAAWEGGDDGCDHSVGKARNDRDREYGRTGEDDTNKIQAKDICPKCGAKRIDSQLGLESTPDQYVAKMVEVFREVRRVLRPDGTLWLNLGDSYMTTPAGNLIPKGINQKKGRREKGCVNSVKKTSKNLKNKDLVGIPWMVAFALRADGWWLRQEIIWHKPNPMPESCTDRCTKAHESIFLLAKSCGKTLLWYNKKTKQWVYEKPDYFAVEGVDYELDDKGDKKSYWRGHDYYYDMEAIKEKSIDPESIKGRRKRNAQQFDSERFSDTRKGFEKLDGQIYEKRNKRSVWTITAKPYPEAHFATYPPELITPCILAGCPEDGTVLDPFSGAGTTGVVCEKWGRDYIGIELNPEYLEISRKRIDKTRAENALFGD